MAGPGCRGILCGGCGESLAECQCKKSRIKIEPEDGSGGFYVVNTIEELKEYLRERTGRSFTVTQVEMTDAEYYEIPAGNEYP